MQTLNLECPQDKKMNYLFPANPDHAKPLAHQPAGDLVHGGVGGRRHENPDGRPPVAGGARHVPPVHDLQDEAGDGAGLARPRRTLDEGDSIDILEKSQHQYQVMLGVLRHVTSCSAPVVKLSHNMSRICSICQGW